MKAVCTLAFIIFTCPLLAQHELLVGTEIPVQYKIGYAYTLSEKISVGASLGILTKPYDNMILNFMESMGVDEATVRIIDEMFTLGFIYEVEGKYHLKNWYLAPKFQVIHLTSDQTSVEDIEQITELELPNPRRSRANVPDNDLQLKSDLFQAGIGVGRKFFFTGKPYHIDIGLIIAFNIGSKSKLSSESRSLEAVSQELDAELKETYSSYAHLPSLKIGLVWQLKSKY